MTDRDAETDYDRAQRQQGEVANPAYSALVLANAGSGKTKVLIDRVARLLLRRPEGGPGAAPDSILCITYTRAAANEMLHRLFATLGKWAIMPDETLRGALAALEGRCPAEYLPEDLRAARALFARALETPGGLRIETIHAFCARVLRRFPLEAGVLPGFSELEEEEARTIWHGARDAAILAAARDQPEPLALIATEAGYDGAASALDSLRHAYWPVMKLAERHDLDLDRIAHALRIAIGAPDQSADALLAQAMGPDLPAGVLAEILDPLASGAKTDIASAALIERTLAAGTSPEKWDAYRGLFLTADDKFRKANPFTKSPAKADPRIADLFETALGTGAETVRIRTFVETLAKARAYERTAALFAVGLPALLAYDSAKARRGALDFDDLIERTRTLLVSEGMSSWVLYKLDGGITHVLLDEAQDTSPAQWELVRTLTHEFGVGDGRAYAQDPRTKFVVGDEKQSIYSFQGADPSKFLGEARALLGALPDFRNETLQMSFRSCPEVLTFVDAVWNSAPAIALPFAGDMPLGLDLIRHTARRSGEAGLVELWPIAPRAEDAKADLWARPLDVLRETSPKAQLANHVADAVRDMLNRGAPVWDGNGRPRAMRAEDIMILVSKRQGGLFAAIIAALKSRGVPVAGADRLRLTDHIGVQDCLNLMRFACLPARDLTLAEILRGPFLGLVDDDRYLYGLAAGRAAGVSLWQRVQESPDAAVQGAAAFLGGLVARAHLPAFEFLSAVLDQPGASGQTGWEQINVRLGPGARDPVEALVNQALEADSVQPSSLQMFVARVEAEAAEIKRDLAEATHEVRVMTVHGAKGLQAPVVILPDTTSAPKTSDDTLFETPDGPVWSPRKDADTAGTARVRAELAVKGIEEHRRLLYVAMTRAQDRLIIAGHWHGTGVAGFNAQSWYALCQTGMAALGAAPDAAGILRVGAPPADLAQDGAGRARAPDLPDWALRPPRPDGVTRRLSAPTSLLGPKTATAAPFDQRREARLRRGRLIHALLQYLPELPEARRRAAGKAMLAREAALTAPERAEMLKAALGVIADPGMREVFAPGGRAEAAIIGTAPELAEGLVINGRADRLVIGPGAVWVIDYKTDQPAPPDIGGVAEGYVLQMAAYWAVLREAFPGRDVVAALCWTDGPQLMRLPEDLMLAALKRAHSPV